MTRVNLEGWGGGEEESSFINRLDSRTYFWDTTEHYISEALLLHVERFFCEEVRTLNQGGSGILHVQ